MEKSRERAHRGDGDGHVRRGLWHGHSGKAGDRRWAGEKTHVRSLRRGGESKPILLGGFYFLPNKVSCIHSSVCLTFCPQKRRQKIAGPRS